MNIVHIGMHCPPADLTGSERYMWEMSRELAKRHKVAHICAATMKPPYRPDFSVLSKEVIDRVEVWRSPNDWISSAYWTARRQIQRSAKASVFGNLRFTHLKAVIKETNPDIIHATPFPVPFILDAQEVAEELGIPFVFTPFYAPTDKYHKPAFPFFKEVFKKADGVVVCSNSELEEVILLGVRGATLVTPMGTDKGNYERKGDGLTLLFMGSKTEGKGLYTVLEAVRVLHKRGIPVKLVIAGPDTNEWKRRRNDYLDTQFEEYGFVPAGAMRDELFSRADVFVLPSVSDTFGIVYCMAWDAGIPVIAADTPAMREVIGHAGLFVRPGDATATADAVLHLLKEKEVTKRRVEEGKRKIRRWPEVAEALESFYCEVINNRRYDNSLLR